MILFNSIFPGGLPLKDLIAYPNKVKFAKLGDSLLYDTQKESLYGDINITSIYANNKFEATGGNITPNILIKQPWTKIGYSGNEYPQQDINTYTVSYSAEYPVEGFTLNTTTGEVTCSENTTEKSKQFAVQVTITMNISGDKEIIYFDFTQNAGEKEVVEEWVTEEITIEYIDKIPPNENTIDLTTEAKQYKYYYTYINGVLNNDLTKRDPYPRYTIVTPTYSVTGTGFSIINNTQLHVDSRGEEISGDRQGTITATYYENGKKFTDQLIVTQVANGKVKVVVPPAEGYFTYYPVSNEGCQKKAIDEMNIELLIEENYLSGHYVNNSRPQPVPITSIAQLQKFLTYPEDYWFGIVEPCFDYNETDFGTNACEVWEEIGAINWTENTTGQARQAKIGLFVCTGVENGIRKYECVLESATTQQEIVTYKINDTLLNFTAANSTRTPIITCTKYIEGEASGEPFELTDYTLIEIEGSDSSNGFTTNGKNVTAKANTGIKRSAKFIISVGQNTINPEYYESGILTCTQNADIATIEYGDIEITGTFEQTIPASGGTVTVSAIATQKITTTYASGKDTEVVIKTLLPDDNKASEYTVTGDYLKDSEKSKQTLLNETLYWSGEDNKKAVKRLIVQQQANTATNELQSIEVTKFLYNGNINYLSLAQSSEPTIEVSGTYKRTFTSRYSDTYSETITDDYTKAYRIIYNSSNFTVNSNGVVQALSKNITGDLRKATVEVEVTYDSKKCTKTCDVYQSTGASGQLITLTIQNPLNQGWIISDKELSYSTYDPTKVSYNNDILEEVSIPVYVYRVDYNSLTPIFSLKQYDDRDNIIININAI